MALLIFEVLSGTLRLPQSPASHVTILPDCSISPQLRPTWARQVHRLSACHTKCAILAIDLALYVASIDQCSFSVVAIVYNYYQ